MNSPVFPCSFENCKRVFRNKFSLNRHELAHTQVRSFTCKFCHKSFILCQYLKEHEYIHTKELPYVCGVSGCTKRFRQAGKLSLHRRTHPEYRTKQYDYSLNKNQRINRKNCVNEKLKNNHTKMFISTNIDQEKEIKLPMLNKELLEYSNSLLTPSRLEQKPSSMKPSTFSLAEIEINKISVFVDYLERSCITTELPSLNKVLGQYKNCSLDIITLATKYNAY